MTASIASCDPPNVTLPTDAPYQGRRRADCILMASARGRHSSLVDWRPRDLGPEHWRSPSLSVTGRGSYPALVATPQTGIFALGTMSHAYLELDVRPGVDPRDLIAAVASLREPRTTIGGVNLVTGFRPELWASVASDAAPAGLRGFNEPLVGRDGYTLAGHPARRRGLALRRRLRRRLRRFARHRCRRWQAQATLAHEIVGWPYHRDRDLTGFEDGTRESRRSPRRRSGRLDRPGFARRGRKRPAASAMGARRRPGGRRCRSPSRNGPWVERKLTSVELDPRPETSHVGAHRPGPLRQDLPTQHRLRLARPTRHDLRRLQSRPRSP